MTRLVMDTHSDLDLVGSEVRFGRGCSRDMTMFQTDANRSYMRGDPLCSVVDLIETSPSLGQSTSYLVHDAGSCKTSEKYVNVA